MQNDDINLDLDTFVDPKTKKLMYVHTHPEDDKQKMNLRWIAEAKEGEGKAQSSGLISHKNVKDVGTIKLDVMEDSYDSDEINIEAKETNDNKKDMNNE